MTEAVQGTDCFICRRTVSSPEQVQDLINQICQDEEGGDGPRGETSAPSKSTQINVDFVFEDLLQVPFALRRKLHTTHGAPTQWGLSFCLTCTEMIEDAEELENKIKNYSNELGVIKNNLQTQLKESDTEVNNSSTVSNIREQVIKSFISGSKEFSPSVPSTPKTSSRHDSTEVYSAVDINNIKDSPKSVPEEDDEFQFEFGGEEESNPSPQEFLDPGSILKLKVDEEDDEEEDFEELEEMDPNYNPEEREDEEETENDQNRPRLMRRSAVKARNETSKMVKIESEEEEELSQSPSSKSRRVVGLRNKHQTVCPICNKSFPSANFLNLHHKKVHMGVDSITDRNRSRALKKKNVKSQMKMDNTRLTLTARNQERKYTVPCSDCPQFFPSEYFRDAHHKRRHLGIVKCFQCEGCGKAFDRHGSLTYHKKSCKGNGIFLYPADPKLQEVKEFQCPHCPMHFKNEVFKIAHIKRKHEGLEKCYDCHICNKAFSRHRTLQDHLKAVHKLINMSHEEEFNPANSMYLNDHWGGPGEGGEAEEGIGDDVEMDEMDDDELDDFSSGSESEFELKPESMKKKPKPSSGSTGKAGNKRPRKYECSFEGCEKRFCVEIIRDAHYRKIHEGVEKPFKCGEDGCPKWFKVYLSLRVHQKVYHAKEKETLVCDTCGKTYYNRIAFKRHGLTHTKKKEIKYEQACDECGKLFQTKGHLARHKMLHAQPATCETCGVGFVNRTDLFNHQRLEHQIYEVTTKPKSEICDQCGKGFTSTTSLKKHMETLHQGIYRFSCTICNKGYPDKSSYERHLVTHTGEKKFVCDICGKGTTRSADLIRHKRLHTGEKPYLCSMCNEPFADTSKVRKHMKTAHGPPENQCEICGKKFYTYSQLRVHKTIHDPNHVSNRGQRTDIAKKRASGELGPPKRPPRPRKPKSATSNLPRQPKTPNANLPGTSFSSSSSGRKGRPRKKKQTEEMDDSDSDIEYPAPSSSSSSAFLYGVPQHQYLQQGSASSSPGLYNHFESSTNTYRPNNPLLMEFQSGLLAQQQQSSQSQQSQPVNLVHGHSQSQGGHGHNSQGHGGQYNMDSNRYLQQLQHHLNLHSQAHHGSNNS